MRQTDRQTDRQTGRQTDRQTNRQTDRQTKYINIFTVICISVKINQNARLLPSCVIA